MWAIQTHKIVRPKSQHQDIDGELKPGTESEDETVQSKNGSHHSMMVTLMIILHQEGGRRSQ